MTVVKSNCADLDKTIIEYLALYGLARNQGRVWRGPKGQASAKTWAIPVLQRFNSKENSFFFSACTE